MILNFAPKCSNSGHVTIVLSSVGQSARGYKRSAQHTHRHAGIHRHRTHTAKKYRQVSPLALVIKKLTRQLATSKWTRDSDREANATKTRLKMDPAATRCEPAIAPGKRASSILCFVARQSVSRGH